MGCIGHMGDGADDHPLTHCVTGDTGTKLSNDRFTEVD